MESKGLTNFVVINPKSANGRTGKLWPCIRQKLVEAIGEFEEAFTTGPGHATELTRQALARGAQRIISVGGDGTNNEVLNGFFDETGQMLSQRAELGLVPSGTGGDFIKTVGLTAESWVSALKSGKSREIDIGRAEFFDHQGRKVQRFFLNIVSFGLSGKVDQTVNRTSKALGGKVSFLLATIRSVLGWQNQRVQMKLKDSRDKVIFEKELPIVTVAAANGQYFGGGMWIAPQASVTDGSLDVVVLGDLAKSTLLTQTNRIYRGTHLEMENVWNIKAASLEATSEEEVLIDLDGEAVGRLPIRVDIIPGALRLICV